MRVFFNRSLFYSFVLLLMLTASGASAKYRDPLEKALPDMEVIPGARWFWAAPRMAYNNVPMSIKLFTFVGSTDQVERFYNSLWKSKGHGKTNSRRAGDLTILSLDLDGYLYTVQFSQKGKVVDGKIVVSLGSLNANRSTKTRFSLPPRTKVISKIEALDNGRRSETLELDSRLQVPQIVDFYLSSLERDGWSFYSNSGDGRSNAVLSFKRQGELLQLTINGLQGRNSKFSQVLIHWLK